jgi:hypothetical protein
MPNVIQYNDETPKPAAILDETAFDRRHLDANPNEVSVPQSFEQSESLTPSTNEISIIPLNQFYSGQTATNTTSELQIVVENPLDSSHDKFQMPVDNALENKLEDKDLNLQSKFISRDNEEANLECPSHDDNLNNPHFSQVEAINNDRNKPSNSIEVIGTTLYNLNESNRVESLKSIAQLILSKDQEAKVSFKEHDGLQILMDTINDHMSNLLVIEITCELLLALVTSSDGNSESDVLTGSTGEGVVHALMIAMGTNMHIESIQWSGCSTLNCLASASGTNSQVPDGSESGSVFIVVLAMIKHRDSQYVQESGIRALYSLCMLSKYAAYNKVNLVNFEHDGVTGIDVITYIMESATTDLVSLELACRLYWSLGADDDAAQKIMKNRESFNALVNVINRNLMNPETVPMLQAVFGALSNLARAHNERNIFVNSDIIEKTMKCIQNFPADEVLYIEACTLLSALALDEDNKQNLLAYDVVNVISNLIPNYYHNQELKEEALWFLVCLSHKCDIVKEILSSETNLTIGNLVRIMHDSGNPLSIREKACILTGSLCTLKESARVAVTNGAIDAVLSLLRDFPKEIKIHEASFLTFRNITKQGYGIDLFFKHEAAKIVLDAMVFSEESLSAQSNVCSFLWNICAKSRKDPSYYIDAGAIKNIVSAMQRHMESGEVLQMACGALWCFTDQSEVRKLGLLDCHAIDAVACCIDMNPNEPASLEQAFGLLAHICTVISIAEAIAKKQGISIVVEVMTANTMALKLLELGALFLRNMALTKQEFADESSNGVPVILRCMNENPGAVDFQREACFALWALAAQSNICKDKIDNLDGVSIIATTRDRISYILDVHAAACGALREIAPSIQQ